MTGDTVPQRTQRNKAQFSMCSKNLPKLLMNIKSKFPPIFLIDRWVTHKWTWIQKIDQSTYRTHTYTALASMLPAVLESKEGAISLWQPRE